LGHKSGIVKLDGKDTSGNAPSGFSIRFSAFSNQVLAPQNLTVNAKRRLPFAKIENNHISGQGIWEAASYGIITRL
jgi:hypothetical protein